MHERRHSKDCKGMRMPQSIPRGLLRFLIIRLLKSNELTGSEIITTLSERSGGDWRPSPGSIYPLLSSLEDEGVIEITRTEGRSKTYALTDEGKSLSTDFWKHKGKFHHKAHLGPMLWDQLMEPSDKARFHLGLVEFHFELISNVIDSLNESQKQRLLKRIEKISSNLDAMINTLKP